MSAWRVRVFCVQPWSARRYPITTGAMRRAAAPLYLALFSFPLLATTAAEKLETVGMFSEKHQLKCSQGLTDCRVEEGEVGVQHKCFPLNENGDVGDLAAQALLCKTEHQLRPCFRIHFNITREEIPENSGLSLEGSNEDGSKEEEHQSGLGHLISPSASVQVCYQIPEFSYSKKLSFSLSDDNTQQMWMSLIVLMDEAQFGNDVAVYTFTGFKHIKMPSRETVCSQHLDIKMCKAPILQLIMNNSAEMVELHVENDGKKKLLACKKMEKGGDCRDLNWKESPMRLPMSSVAPCLCFQLWWENGPRREMCPFVNYTELSGSNISVSVVEAQTHDMVLNRDSSALTWNISAPCKLEAELHLCKKTSGSDTRCSAMNHTELRVHEGWREHNGKWHLNGHFDKVERHPALCVQVKVKGVDRYFKLLCPFEETRNHWSLTLLVCIILLCLTILGAYALQGTMKGWVFRWLKVDDINREVGGGQVVLLYPPDADSSLAELVCRLGSSLSSLGFSVSLDLWSRSELSALGPVPWLHSRLDRVQRHGGKVVLVLTEAAWARAEEWGRRSGGGDRDEPKAVNEEGGWENGGRSLLPCSDVFSASLSCILADYLQGRAGERFALAQFDSQPAGPPSGGGVLPELFRGLPFFSLPSQSLGFLTEIAQFARKGQPERGGLKVNRSVRAGVLRAASRNLAGTLRELTGSGTGYKLAGLSQDCVGFGPEDPWESIPLQPGESSPVSSPELHGKLNAINWV